MKKVISSFLMLLASSSFFATGVFADTLTPHTGDRAAPLVPFFVVMMIVAVAAIVVCLVLLKKKK